MNTENGDNFAGKRFVPNGIGAFRYKNGRVTIVAAILEHANLQGNEEDEARKVANILRQEGSGWNPARVSIAKVKHTMRRIQARMLQGEKIVSLERRKELASRPPRKAFLRMSDTEWSKMRETTKTAQDVIHQSSPYSPADTKKSTGLASLVSRMNDLKVALEMALEEVKRILE